MIRILTIMLTVLCLTSTAYAMPEPLKQGTILRGSFTQMRYMVGFDKPLKSEGTFVVAPDRGVIWNVVKPFEITTIITPHGLVQSNKGKRVMNLSARQAPFIEQIYKMIGGVLARQWDGMHEKFVVEKAAQQSSWSIKLTPLKTKQQLIPFQEVSVTGDAYVQEVVMTKKDGSRDVISFTKVVASEVVLSEVEKVLFEMSAP